MTQKELNEYAVANRDRLSKQKITLGDTVMILIGPFTGEQGVIKGILVYGNDFTDPFYEVDMACEVPERYKCRKTIVGSENVVGGFSAREFEIIDSRCPEPTAEEGKENEHGLSDDVGTVSEETANRLAKQLNSLRAIQSETSSLAWQPYRMELAEKIAVAYAEKGRYEPSEIGAKAVAVANGVINELKNERK